MMRWCGSCGVKVDFFPYKHNECGCGAHVCDKCRIECPGCGRRSCRDCNSDNHDGCCICEEEDHCNDCVEGEYCHGCFLACRIAVAWCCKNIQQTHQALLEDVVERLVVIPRDDGEHCGKRRRRDSE